MYKRYESTAASVSKYGGNPIGYRQLHHVVSVCSRTVVKQQLNDVFRQAAALLNAVNNRWRYPFSETELKGTIRLSEDHSVLTLELRHSSDTYIGRVEYRFRVSSDVVQELLDFTVYSGDMTNRADTES